MSENKEEKNQSLTNSLRYPLFTLEMCLEKIKTLFEKNSKNSMSTDAIVADLGFSPNSGSASSWVAALKYYGLLVKVDAAKNKIAEFSFDYCISGNLNHDILFTALNTVPINKKIFAKYDFNQLPSENEIKFFLIKECNYDLKQATKYIEIFNKNKKFYTDNTDKKIDIIPVSNVEPKTETNNLAPPAQVPQYFTPSANNSAIITYPLSDGKNISISLPNEIKELDMSDLEDIKDILQFVLNKINKIINNKGE
jgi:hypothetical protein